MSGKILIYRRGSIGDAIVTIPALNYLRAREENAEIRILTNLPVMERAAPISSILQGTPLCDGIFELRPGGGGLSALSETRRNIASWGPDKIIYLSEPSRPFGLLREYLYFRSCGIRKFEGLPWGSALRTYLQKGGLQWESESERLLRAITADENHDLDWEFRFREADQRDAERIISGWPGKENYIALSIGAKLPDKDWGDQNWSVVFKHLATAEPGLGLMVIGAEQERERSQNLLADWSGPVLNLCGESTPLVSALLMKEARFYLGHDSGPMHLAALVGVRCVALFSARAKPGVWFPHGPGHEILYPWELVPGVSAKTGLKTAGNSIQSVQPADVIEACRKLLAAGTLADA